MNPTVSNTRLFTTAGNKNYELSNHLGNVLAVITDKKIPRNTENTPFFETQITSVSDFYPFGSLLEGRHESSEDYRYGFNGMEKDDEVKGSGNHLDFGARCYDPRVGKFLSIDAMTAKFCNQSPYISSGNNPVFYIDLNGDFKIVVTQEAKDAGVTEQQIQRFTTIVNNIQKYFSENPEIVTYLSKQTGLSEEQILADAVPGKGPTIQITVQPVASPAAEVPQKGDFGYVEGDPPIRIDFGIVNQLENFDKDDPLFLTEVLAIAQTVIHEFVHYGDIVTNDGFVTGQVKSDEHFLDGSQPIKFSFSRHRGTDVDVMFFGYSVAMGLLTDEGDYGDPKQGMFIANGELEMLKKKSQVDQIQISGRPTSQKGWSDDRVKSTFLSINGGEENEGK